MQPHRPLRNERPRVFFVPLATRLVPKLLRACVFDQQLGSARLAEDAKDIPSALLLLQPLLINCMVL